MRLSSAGFNIWYTGICIVSFSLLETASSSAVLRASRKQASIAQKDHHASTSGGLASDQPSSRSYAAEHHQGIKSSARVLASLGADKSATVTRALQNSTGMFTGTSAPASNGGGGGTTATAAPVTTTTTTFTQAPVSTATQAPGGGGMVNPTTGTTAPVSTSGTFATDAPVATAAPVVTNTATAAPTTAPGTSSTATTNNGSNNVATDDRTTSTSGGNTSTQTSTDDALNNAPTDDAGTHSNDDHVTGGKWAKVKKPSMSDIQNQGTAVAKDPNVWIAAVVLSVVGFFFLLFVVHQLVENPNGCISKFLRCLVATFRILCYPCRKLCCCCCPGAQARPRRGGRSSVSTDDDDNYGRDLELT
jgi:hypothetical protein